MAPLFFTLFFLFFFFCCHEPPQKRKLRKIWWRNDEPWITRINQCTLFTVCLNFDGLRTVSSKNDSQSRDCWWNTKWAKTVSPTRRIWQIRSYAPFTFHDFFAFLQLFCGGSHIVYSRHNEQRKFTKV